MIVKDSAWSLSEASRIGTKLTQIITEEVRTFKGEDDFSEIIYVIGHSVSNFLGRMLIYFEGVGETYNIDMNRDKILEWLISIAKATTLASEEDLKQEINKENK